MTNYIDLSQSLVRFTKDEMHTHFSRNRTCTVNFVRCPVQALAGTYTVHKFDTTASAPVPARLATQAAEIILSRQARRHKPNNYHDRNNNLSLNCPQSHQLADHPLTVKHSLPTTTSSFPIHLVVVDKLAWRRRLSATQTN